MRFLRSRYVLFLLLAVLAVEAMFRFALYEAIVSPYSHSGTTITVKRAVGEFGKDEVDVITLGDSRTAQGLDNDRIYKAGAEAGLDHLKLSMPGSHFLTLKAMAAWSLDELDSLRGVVIALSPAAFAYIGNGAYELAKVMPLRNEVSAGDMFHHVPFRRSDIRTFAPLFSVAGYRDDIKDLLADPGARFEAVSARNGRAPLNILAYTGKETDDICGVPVEDPEACLEALEQPGAQVLERARAGLQKMCQAGTKDKKSKPNNQAAALAEEWVSFLETLSSKVRVMFVVLPELTAYRRYAYHPNSMHVYDVIVSRLREGGRVEVVDLLDVLLDQPGPECGFFLDSTHLNLHGKEVVTDALLPNLEAFWREMGAPD